MDLSNPRNPLILGDSLGLFTSNTPITWPAEQHSLLSDHLFTTPSIQQFFQSQRLSPYPNAIPSYFFGSLYIPGNLLDILGFADLHDKTTNFKGENIKEIIKDRIRETLREFYESIMEAETKKAVVNAPAHSTAPNSYEQHGQQSYATGAKTASKLEGSSVQASRSQPEIKFEGSSAQQYSQVREPATSPVPFIVSSSKLRFVTPKQFRSADAGFESTHMPAAAFLTPSPSPPPASQQNNNEAKPTPEVKTETHKSTYHDFASANATADEARHGENPSVYGRTDVDMSNHHDATKHVLEEKEKGKFPYHLFPELAAKSAATVAPAPALASASASGNGDRNRDGAGAGNRAGATKSNTSTTTSSSHNIPTHKHPRTRLSARKSTSTPVTDAMREVSDGVPGPDPNLDFDTGFETEAETPAHHHLSALLAKALAEEHALDEQMYLLTGQLGRLGINSEKDEEQL